MPAAKQAVEERICFENQSMETLVGILNEAGSADTVILCHGYADTKNGFHLPALAQALADKGYCSLRCRPSQRSTLLHTLHLCNQSVQHTLLHEVYHDKHMVHI